MEQKYKLPSHLKFFDDFPYKKLSMNIQDIDQRFKNLKEYNYNLLPIVYDIRNIPGKWYQDKNTKFNGTVITSDEKDYELYNNISDYFMDECRMKAKRYDRELCPWDFWDKNKKLVAGVALKKFGKAGKYELREAIYYTAGEPTSFKPTLVITFIKMFNVKTILDFCSGWGDRLIAAMAMDIDFYCGVDPNSQLHPKYKEMINHFTKKPENFLMIQSPFEKVVLPDVTYDLIITSPPYFDLEIYSKENTQSIHNRNVNEWFDDFLIFSLNKAWKYLNVGGHMVIVINDIYNKNAYVKNMIDTFSAQNSDAIYEGVLCYSEIVDNKVRNPQPCWIWQKI
jgi:hypothetical protein